MIPENETANQRRQNADLMKPLISSQMMMAGNETAEQGGQNAHCADLMKPRTSSQMMIPGNETKDLLQQNVKTLTCSEHCGNSQEDADTALTDCSEGKTKPPNSSTQPRTSSRMMMPENETKDLLQQNANTLTCSGHSGDSEKNTTHTIHCGDSVKDADKVHAVHCEDRHEDTDAAHTDCEEGKNHPPSSSTQPCLQNHREDKSLQPETRPSVPAEDGRCDAAWRLPSSPQTSLKRASAASEKIDTALHTLKSELMAMREQDLQLLKQLIHINDSIRRLKRARWLQRGAGRTVSCGLLGARNPTSLPPGDGGPGGAKDRVSMLLRQRSEPGLLGVPCRTMSNLTSTSSFETIADDEEEADSLYGSATDLPSDSSPLVSPFSPTNTSAPSTPLARCPSAYTSLTFTQEELWRGESSYGEILKRNVRLWKWSVARERDSGVVEGHPCVL